MATKWGIPKNKKGNQRRVSVEDIDGNELLLLIYKELQKLNLHLSMITDSEMNDKDTKGG